MELGSHLLGNRLVGGIPDEQVAEAVRDLAREEGLVRSDQLLAHEGAQEGGNRGIERLVGERLHRAAVEHLALDGSALDHRPLVAGEAIEASGEQRVDSGRDGDGHQVAHPHPATTFRTRTPSSMSIESISSTKSGFPSAASAMRVPTSSASSASPTRFATSSAHSRFRQRLEQHGRRVELAAAPRRASVEQLGSSHAEKQDRDSSRPVGEVLDEVEERRLSPVDVVEHHDERTPRRESLEEARGSRESSPRRRRRLRKGRAPRSSAGRRDRRPRRPRAARRAAAGSARATPCRRSRRHP